MLTYERSNRCGWILRAAAVLIVTASMPAGVGMAAPTTQPAPLVDVRPAAITMDAPPSVDAQRSCVLYRHGRGQMKVLSAEPSDPALTVTVREDRSAGSWVVETMIPAGYETPASRQAEIVVKTQLLGDPRAHAAFGSQAQARGEAQSSPRRVKTETRGSAPPRKILVT